MLRTTARITALGVMLATGSLIPPAHTTVSSGASREVLARALEQEAQEAAAWTIDSGGARFAGGCAGYFIGPRAESNGAEILYGGRQECTEPVSQSLTFRLQRCYRTGVCVRFTTVDEVKRTELVRAFTVTAQPRCASQQLNTYRLEVDAMAHGVSARAISDQVELPCLVN